MKISTSAFSGEFPRQFGTFCELIGEDTWFRRCRAVADEVRGNPLLREFLREDNKIALELLKLSECSHRHQPFPPINVDRIGQYEAVTFVVQSLNFIEQADNKSAHASTRRVQAAFSNPSDLRGLAFEFLVATHVIKSGGTVQPPNDGTYDWLAERRGLQFEVECKSISNDKGRRVHMREALMFAGLVKKDMGKIISRMRDGLIVQVSVPDRLPSEYSAQKQLAELVKRAVLSAQTVSDAGTTIALTQFSVVDSPMRVAEVAENDLRAFVKQKLGTAVDTRAVVFHKPSERAFLLVIDSQLPDILLEETFDSIKDAVARQLTGRRPGIVCVKFESLTDSELVSVAERRDDVSALRVLSSRFLQRRGIDHLANIAFMADGPIVDKGSGQFTRGGATYFFENVRSRYAKDPRLQIFADRNGSTEI